MIKLTSQFGDDMWLNPPFDAVTPHYSISYGGQVGDCELTDIWLTNRENAFTVKETVEEVIEKYQPAVHFLAAEDD